MANHTARSLALLSLKSIALLFLVNCGEEGPTEPTPNTVGPEGGTLEFAGGNVSLAFPPGAVSQNLTVTAQGTTSFPASPRIVQGTAYRFGPEAIIFSRPVELTIKYDPASLPAGVQESSLEILEVVNDAWRELSGSRVDVAARRVTASIAGFSVLGVGFSAVDQPDLKLPLPGERSWLLSVEVGRPVPTSQCSTGMGGKFYAGEPDCFHSGKSRYSLDFIDNTAEEGELTGVRDVPILAAGDGTVGTVVLNPGQDTTCRCFGNFVVIEHSNGFSTLYAHLKDGSVAVAKGESVRQGDKIGVMGTSGQSTGIHLHFEVRYANEGELASAILEKVVVDGRGITEYVVGTAATPRYYLSTNRAVPLTLSFVLISAGSVHTCGVTTAGAAYCWGSNSSGKLGNGTTTNSTRPVPVSGGLTFAFISAGHAQGNYTCGVTTGSAAYCWGNNAGGLFGNGTTTGSTVPVPAASGLMLASISSGVFHTCGVTAGGAGYCWGFNTAGHLGDGSRTSSTTPVAVSGGLVFASVNVGVNYTCGLTTGGAAYCWGFIVELNIRGPNQSVESLTPLRVAEGLSFRSLTTGSSNTAHACGVTSDGAAYCWGHNSFGQLGDGTTTDRSAPVLVAGGLSFAMVSAGTHYTCGITTSGEAYCWGKNDSGQLGNGTTTGSAVPVRVSGGLTFASLSTGFGHACGVTPSGAAHCWGANSAGQLGNGTTVGSLVPVPVAPAQ